ncbi:hypothetical protein [Streptomyces noursei]|uniref:hypothetical protein n=1 Tax=Streptomyces noursei TaxID=1971 RepID=UPI0013520C4A
MIEPLTMLAEMPWPAVATHRTVIEKVLVRPEGHVMLPVAVVVALAHVFGGMENEAVPFAVPVCVPVTAHVPFAWYSTGLPGSSSVFTTDPVPFAQVMSTAGAPATGDDAAGAAVAVTTVPARAANSP